MMSRVYTSVRHDLAERSDDAVRPRGISLGENALQLMTIS